MGEVWKIHLFGQVARYLKIHYGGNCTLGEQPLLAAGQKRKHFSPRASKGAGFWGRNLFPQLSLEEWVLRNQTSPPPAAATTTAAAAALWRPCYHPVFCTVSTSRYSRLVSEPSLLMFY